jgi:hypothetical protein
MTTPKLRLEIGGQALSRRQLADKQAAKRLLRKLLKKQMRTPNDLANGASAVWCDGRQEVSMIGNGWLQIAIPLLRLDLNDSAVISGGAGNDHHVATRYFVRALHHLADWPNSVDDR